jgi:YjjG family noncanonical pyrimidine nucleotidase
MEVPDMHHNFLFDLDQTLLNFHSSERKAFEIVITAAGLSFNEDCYEHFKAYNKSLWLELEKGTITRKELFTKRFSDLLDYCEGDSSGIDPLKINDEFIYTMSINGVLMDGAMEFLDRLKTEIKDARCYVVSNGATINAEGRIKSTGMDKYLEKIYVSEWMGVSKPAAEYFDIVLEGVNEPKESCIVIGDSLTSDMLGAKNAGLASVWFMPEGEIEPAMKAYDIDYCASSFDELLYVLKKWVQR